MAKTKKGELLSCGVCGLVVEVSEVGVGAGLALCCDKVMAKGKVAAEKAKKVAVAAAKPKAEAKSCMQNRSLPRLLLNRPRKWLHRPRRQRSLPRPYLRKKRRRRKPAAKSEEVKTFSSPFCMREPC